MGVRDRINSYVDAKAQQRHRAATEAELPTTPDMVMREQQNQSILCPISIDDTWMDETKRNAAIEPHIWSQIKRSNIVSFAGGDFDAAYQKLWKGLQTNYGPRE